MKGSRPTVQARRHLASPQRRFYGTLELDPVKARNQFGQFLDEILVPLASTHGIRVKLTVDLEAEAGGTAGFGEALERTLKENAKALRFKTAELE